MHCCPPTPPHPPHPYPPINISFYFTLLSHSTNTPYSYPYISTVVPLTVEEMLRAELNEKLSAHQQRKANEKEAEKRRLRDMVKTRSCISL